MEVLRELWTRAGNGLRRARVAGAVARNSPIAFRHNGHRYYLGPDSTALYHLTHSIDKLQRLVDLVTPTTAVVVDVGANCGLFSAFLLDRFPRSRVFLIEPTAELLPVIKRNLRGRPATVLCVAASDREAVASFFVDSESKQTSSLSRRSAALFAKSRALEVREVATQTLNNIAEQHELEKVDVLKIDVQGLEGAVLRGATRLLERVQQLFLESTWMDLDTVTEVVPMARRYGFRFLSVVNSVYLGADLLLGRSPPTAACEVTFDLEQAQQAWF